MEYHVIGSVGFAQVGQDNYEKKRKIENEVLRNLIEVFPLFHIPEQFKKACRFKIKTFYHDFSEYHELCLEYDELCLEYVEDLHGPWDQDSPEIFHDFWEWVSDLGSYDFEQTIIRSLCEMKYDGMKMKLYTNNVDGVAVLGITKI